MKKLILNIFICLIFLSEIGFCSDVRKEEISKKIALLAIQEEQINDFHSLDLAKDSLGEIDCKLSEILYSKYSIWKIPEFKIEGLNVFDIYLESLDMDSVQLETIPRPEFLVAVTEDLEAFRLAGFNDQTEFIKMTQNLFKKGMKIKENIIPLSILFYMTAVWPRHVKMISDADEFRKLKKDILSEIDKSTMKTIAKQIEPPTIKEKGEELEVTFFLIVYGGYSCWDWPRIRKVNISADGGDFKIVGYEEISW
jgi:hypothetical protein